MSQVLTSWKEIAHYFGKGVRTVQRWERTLALPVHRPSAQRSIVFAVADELDAWILRETQSLGKTAQIAVLLGSAGDLALSACRQAQQDGFMILVCNRVEQAEAVQKMDCCVTELIIALNLPGDEKVIAEFVRTYPDVRVTRIAPLAPSEGSESTKEIPVYLAARAKHPSAKTVRMSNSTPEQMVDSRRPHDRTHPKSA